MIAPQGTNKTRFALIATLAALMRLQLIQLDTSPILCRFVLHREHGPLYLIRGTIQRIYLLGIGTSKYHTERTLLTNRSKNKKYVLTTTTKQSQLAQFRACTTIS